MKAFPRLILACMLAFALTLPGCSYVRSRWGGASFSKVSVEPSGSVSVPSSEPSSAAPSAPAPAAAAEDATRVIVGFDPGQEVPALSSALVMGATAPDLSTNADFGVVKVPEGADVSAFIDELSTRPGVTYVEPDSPVYALMDSNDPGFPQQWGMKSIGAPAAWDVARGAAIKVAVIDTGVDLSHPEFAGRIDTANDYDFSNGDTTAQDDNGHGTHVAGIIGATLNNGIGVAGVANDCTILPVKVLSANGSGDVSHVAEGIRWAADHGAQVINLSLGGEDYSQTLNDAVQYAVRRDCVVVAATGNTGQDGVIYPAAYANVIGVGSTDSADRLSFFSTYGDGVDVTAPGSNVYSTRLGGGYCFMNGTSMATPHAAGVVALIRAVHREWTRSQVESQLLSTAQDLGSAGKDRYFGYGRVRAAEALGEAGAPLPEVSTRLSAPRVSPSRPKHGRTATFTAWITRGAAASTGTTKLYLFHLERKTVRTRVRGRWRKSTVPYWRLRSTKVMTPGADGRLSARYKVPYAGKWMMVTSYSGAWPYSANSGAPTRFSAR